MADRDIGGPLSSFLFLARTLILSAILLATLGTRALGVADDAS